MFIRFSIWVRDVLGFGDLRALRRMHERAATNLDAAVREMLKK